MKKVLSVQSVLHPTPPESLELIEDNFVELTYEDGSQRSRGAVVLEPCPFYQHTDRPVGRACMLVKGQSN